MTMLLEQDDITSDAIHIIIADAHPLVRGAFRQALRENLPDAQISEAVDQATLSRELSRAEPVDLVLLDPAMPGVSGFTGLLYLRSQHPNIPVVVVSATEDPQVIHRAIAVGAAGFIPEDTTAEPVVDAIRTVLAGEIWVPDNLEPSGAPDATVAETMRRLATLTPQQLRVLMMLGQGLLNKQIAYQLTVSEATVKAHVSAVLQKLGVDSRTQAVLAVSKIEHGQFSIEPAQGRV